MDRQDGTRTTPAHHARDDPAAAHNAHNAHNAHTAGQGPEAVGTVGRLISHFRSPPCCCRRCYCNMCVLLLLATWAVGRPTTAFLPFPPSPFAHTPLHLQSFSIPSHPIPSPISPIPEHMGMSTSGAAPGCTYASCTHRTSASARPALGSRVI